VFARFTGSQYGEHFHDGIDEHYGRVFIAPERFGRLGVDLTSRTKILLTGQIAWFSFLASCECGFMGFYEADSTSYASILSCKLRIVISSTGFRWQEGSAV